MKDDNKNQIKLFFAIILLKIGFTMFKINLSHVDISKYN